MINVVEFLNQDLANEYKHHRFYLHAGFVLTGLPRLFLGPWLKDQATEELSHVTEFANKVVAYGGQPTVGNLDFPTDLTNAKDILAYAVAMEKEVVENYKNRIKMLEDYDMSFYDLILLYEEQVEHSQADIDEMVKILSGM